jgi:hypothetical protein
VLDEIVMGGMVLETNIQSILMSVAEMQKMDTASQKMGLEANKGPGMTKPS